MLKIDRCIHVHHLHGSEMPKLVPISTRNRFSGIGDLALRKLTLLMSSGRVSSTQSLWAFTVLPAHHPEAEVTSTSLQVFAAEAGHTHNALQSGDQGVRLRQNAIFRRQNKKHRHRDDSLHA